MFFATDMWWAVFTSFSFDLAMYFTFYHPPSISCSPGRQNYFCKPKSIVLGVREILVSIIENFSEKLIPYLLLLISYQSSVLVGIVYPSLLSHYFQSGLV